MPGTAPSTVNIAQVFKQRYEAGAISTVILNVRKLIQGELRWPVRGDNIKGLSQALDPGSVPPESTLLTTASCIHQVGAHCWTGKLRQRHRRDASQGNERTYTQTTLWNSGQTQDKMPLLLESWLQWDRFRDAQTSSLTSRKPVSPPRGPPGNSQESSSQITPTEVPFPAWTEPLVWHRSSGV